MAPSEVLPMKKKPLALSRVDRLIEPGPGERKLL
jgi:hypothetical protein